MSPRMSMGEFFKHCGNEAINGYALRDGQKMPAKYNELVNFVADRMGLSGEDISVRGLEWWLINNRKLEGSCSPQLDTDHVSAVLLIGELPNPDEYVASLPDSATGVFLPSPNIVRDIISKS